MTDDAVDIICDRLELAKFSWDLVLLQEGPASEFMQDSVRPDGHVFFVAPKGHRPRSIAFLLHRRFASKCHDIHFASLDGRIACLDVSHLQVPFRFVSAHAPHSNRPDDEYDAFLSNLDQVVHASQQERRQTRSWY